MSTAAAGRPGAREAPAPQPFDWSFDGFRATADAVKAPPPRRARGHMLPRHSLRASSLQGGGSAGCQRSAPRWRCRRGLAVARWGDLAVADVRR